MNDRKVKVWAISPIRMLFFSSFLIVWSELRFRRISYCPIDKDIYSHFDRFSFSLFFSFHRRLKVIRCPKHVCTLKVKNVNKNKGRSNKKKMRKKKWMEIEMKKKNISCHVVLCGHKVRFRQFGKGRSLTQFDINRTQIFVLAKCTLRTSIPFKLAKMKTRRKRKQKYIKIKFIWSFNCLCPVL